MKNIKIYNGNIIFTKTKDEFTMLKNGYIVVENGKVLEVSESLSRKYVDYPVIDYRNKLIIPGMNDLHAHAAQFKNLGIAMDKELLPWLENYTFPEEHKFIDPEYSKRIYSKFIREIWKQGTTRIALFSNVYTESTKLLMDLLIKSELGAYVGKVNMDRNCPDYICEDTDQTIKDTEDFIKEYANKSDLVKPIITPRFVPTCTLDSMKALGDIAKRYSIPVQSHLSENQGEIDWVHELHPEAKFYGDVYDKCGLFGQVPTIMAHCCYSSDAEIELMKNQNVFAVHCPSSNLNVGSGMMPVRKYLDIGLNVGLGTDISGGHTSSIFKIMVHAIQVSKLFWSNSNKEINFLSNSEAFYLATKGGGAFFGKVGSFEEGYDFDALIIDDSELNYANYSLEERLERFIYVGDDRNIIGRYVRGNFIKEPNA